MTTKTCTSCNITQSFLNFNNSISTVDKLSYRCKDCIHLYYNQYFYMKRFNNPAYRRSHYRRCQLGKILKNRTHKGTFELVSCTLEHLIKHIESKFTKEMSWENHGLVWEIDHITPLCRFDTSTDTGMVRGFHYTNLTPVTIGENRCKGGRVHSVK